jgi:hypothetical protein
MLMPVVHVLQEENTARNLHMEIREPLEEMLPLPGVPYRNSKEINT